MPEVKEESEANQDGNITALADYAGYLLENECGLPKDAALGVSVEALRGKIAELLRSGEIAKDEMRFLVTRAIDIMPVAELRAEALGESFSEEAAERIERAHQKIITTMRSAREGNA